MIVAGVVHGHFVQFSPVHVGADGPDQRVPAVAGLEPVRSGAVLGQPGRRLDAGFEGLKGGIEFLLLRKREIDAARLFTPAGLATYQFETRTTRDRSKFVLLGGVKPLTADIEDEAF